MRGGYSTLLGRSGRSRGGFGWSSGGGGGQHEPPRRRVGPWKVALLLLLLLLLAGLVYALTWVGRAFSASYSPISSAVAPEARAAAVQPGQRINILFMAVDDEQLRTDVLLLASVDLEQKRAAAIQIPRDTRALLAGKGTIEKINHAYAYGEPSFPSNLRTLKSVEGLLGVRIHYTVVLNMAAFIRAIDEIGGVEVEIPFVMEYDDPYQNLHIHFTPGRQILNGQRALEFVRWRHNNDGTGYPDEDLGRIRAQQAFMRTVIQKVTRPGTLLSLPNLILELAPYVESTIEPARLRSLAPLAATLDWSAVEMTTLPGTGILMYDPHTDQPVSYFVHDPVESRKLVDRLVHGIDPAEAAKVRVEVAAAAGDPRGGQVVDRLIEQGFDAYLVAPPQKLPKAVRVVPAADGKGSALLVARSLMAQGFQVEMEEPAKSGAQSAVRIILSNIQEEPARADGIR